MRHRLAVLLALCIAVGCAAAAEDDSSLRSRADTAYWWGDFAALERLRAEAATPDPGAPPGAPKLVQFRRGLRDVLSAKAPGGQKPADSYFVEIDRLTLQWAREHPQSPLAHVLHAEALYEHAWAWRGSGFTNTVTPLMRQEFERYLGRCIQYLADNAAVAQRDTLAFGVLVDAAISAEWPRDRVWAVAQQGLAVDPENIELYSRVLRGLLPKWGGTPVEIDRFIATAIERTRARWGTALYAQLYDQASDQDFGALLFTASGARWPQMKQAFDDWLQRDPSAAVKNKYANYACLAEDKPTTLDLLAQIGETPILDEWGDNPTRTWETCKRWASRQ